jgi:hypothetical protein
MEQFYHPSMLIKIKDTEFIVACHFINARSSAFWVAVSDISELYIGNKVYDSSGKGFIRHVVSCVLHYAFGI